MKYFIGIFLLMGVISCSSDSDNSVVDEVVTVNGTWRPYKYEFRGKNIMLNDCEDKGLIVINNDFSGVYDRYESSATTDDCTLVDSFTGKWTYDKLYNVLTLEYTDEEGLDKTMRKEIKTYSTTELRIRDNSKNLDNQPGNDEAVLVFKREL
ncbi:MULTISPECIES: lipocalin family protein [Chryseobacterium]|uniref:lipocalin family protein n=1 Tax=Chryseobacterium TaxID=59732 RepID=UPI0012975868|nr:MULTISPECIES: lipocalin family protein [Chryseobacterium]MDR6921902.1 hypothetical protein [Chryseobacterium sp. 2987]